MLKVINNWLTTINVKYSFSANPTDQDIKNSASIIVSSMENIQKAFEKVIDNNYLDFDIILDNFKSIIYYINTGKKARDADTLGTWRTWTDAFNEYMMMLYDLADTRVEILGQRGYEDGIYKFIWIK